MEDQPNITQQIGEALRLLRVHHDVELEDLSEMLAVSVPYVAAQLEGGEHYPNLAELERYSEYFNIPVSSIIFIAEHLESARDGKGSFRHCRAADLILQIEVAKAELKNERKQ